MAMQSPVIVSIAYSPNVGGVETHLDDFVRFLQQKSFSSRVLTYQPLMMAKTLPMVEKYNQTTIYRIPIFRGLFYKLVKYPILEFLYLLPGLFVVLPMLLVTTKPKIIHAHGLVAGAVSVFWSKIFGLKSIISTHSIYNFPKSGIYTSYIKTILENADQILCLSHQSVKEIVSLGIDKAKVTNFTYWINLEKFKPSKPKNKIFTVLFVGRLVKEKGVIELLAAAKKWNKNIKLLIAGTGPLAGEIPAENYLGAVSQQELPNIYSQSSITIVPSIHDEGFGRVILESLACGTPVIGSKRGAIPEAMDETVGELIDITVENIVKSVNYWYSHPQRLAKLAKNSRAFALKRYSDKNAEKIICYY